MSKNKIQNYIILEFLKNYATLLFIFSLTIWMMQAVRLLDLIYQDGNTFFVFIKYTVFQLPKVIGKLSVIIFFIAIFWTLNNLEESNEIRNISFFGIDPEKFFFKFVKFTFFFSLIIIFLKAFIVPYFNKKSRILLIDEGIGAFSNLLKENNFNNPSKLTTIYIKEKNKIGELKNIIIFQENENKFNKVIIAKNGVVTKIKNETYFVAESGIIQEANPNGNISQINFDKTSIDTRDFKKKSADYYKFNEMLFVDLLKLFLNAENTRLATAPLSEIAGMILTPLILPTLVLIFLNLILYRELTINRKKLKFYLFFAGFAIIFILELLISYSQKNIFYFYASFFYVFSIFFIIIFILNFTKKL